MDTELDARIEGYRVALSTISGGATQLLNLKKIANACDVGYKCAYRWAKIGLRRNCEPYDIVKLRTVPVGGSVRTTKQWAEDFFLRLYMPDEVVESLPSQGAEGRPASTAHDDAVGFCRASGI